MNAVRYAASVFSPDNTNIVLFNVRNQLSSLFSDLNSYPHYKKRVTHIKKWATEQKKEICAFMENAGKILQTYGFPPDAITTKTPSKSLGITEDILKESYQDYHAVVVGRTGLSRFKDWLVKSAAIKLVGKIKHIPVIVVGGCPTTDKLLVAFDGTRGAMKGVACVGMMLKSASNHLQLFSMIKKKDKFWDLDDDVFIPEEGQQAGAHADCDLLEKIREARHRMLDDGIEKSRVSTKVYAADRVQPTFIVRQAMENDFGSIVVGRRGLISFIESFFIGRVSKKILDMADQLAVWVI